MTKLDDLEELAILMQKGIITKAAFEERKQKLLSEKTIFTDEKQKSRAIYVLFGFWLGFFGVHNLYAGYINRALIQVLLTVGALFFSPAIVPGIWLWGIVETFTIKKDAKGVPFRPATWWSTILFIICLPIIFEICVLAASAIF